MDHICVHRSVDMDHISVEWIYVDMDHWFVDMDHRLVDMDHRQEMWRDYIHRTPTPEPPAGRVTSEITKTAVITILVLDEPCVCQLPPLRNYRWQVDSICSMPNPGYRRDTWLLWSSSLSLPPWRCDHTPHTASPLGRWRGHVYDTTGPPSPSFLLTPHTRSTRLSPATAHGQTHLSCAHRSDTAGVASSPSQRCGGISSLDNAASTTGTIKHVSSSPLLCYVCVWRVCMCVTWQEAVVLQSTTVHWHWRWS